MNNKKVWKSEYFFGNKISNYGLENHFVDYGTLAKSFDAVLCNNITKLFYCEISGEYSEVELVNGLDCDDESNEYYDIFQYFIIDSNGVNILKEFTDEIVYYIEPLDMYVWGVTHFGTNWSDVLTDIRVEV